MKRIHNSVCAVLTTALLTASPSDAATWKNNVNYGGSGGFNMDLYVPDKPATSPAIVVAIHFCNGNSGSTHSWFQSMSDKYGFIIISPGAGTNCWDSSPGRSGSKAAIVQMVQYVVKQNNADSNRVFAAGASSGACMTQTLLASYPEVFAAGSSLAGVPVGQWPPGTSCDGVCNTVAPSKTAQQWGDLARAADPGYTGTRPRVQLWHGTSDNVLLYPSMSDAEDAQWKDVFGVTDANATKETGKPSSSWTRTSYKGSSGTVVLEVEIGQGQPHDLTSVNPSLFPDVIRFFGLDQASTPGTGGTGGGVDGAAGSGGKKDGGIGGTGGAKDAALDGPGGSDAGGIGGAGSGGSIGSGGKIGSGGTSGKGGAPGSGGSQGSGGSAGTISGGAPGNGGSTSGGTPGSGSSSAKGGNGGPGSDGSTAGGGNTSGGCSCSVGSTTAPGKGIALLLFAAVGLVLRLRRSMRR
jgi:acetylxylan esterase